MSSSHEVSSLNENEKKIKYSDGVRGWLTVMVFVIASFLVLDNYHRHGIIKNPFEIVSIVVDIARNHAFLLVVTIIFWFMQIAHSFIIEKLLLHNIIAENLGLTLHALNAFYLLTVVLITGHLTKANPFVLRVFLQYIAYSITKVWSYGYKNYLYRQISKKDHKEDDFKDVQYPANVTLKNLLIYFICTPPIEYQTSYPQRTKPDWKLFAKLVSTLFIVYWAFTFIIYQLIFPEILLLRSSNQNLLLVLITGLRLTLPINLGFYLMNYTNSYKLFMPAYAAWTGMKEIEFSKDWWNAENVTVFWRKWNLPIHHTLKYQVYVPLIRRGYNHLYAQCCTVALAGILHEYLNTLPFGIYNGSAFVHTMLEIPIGQITARIERKYGCYYGNMLLWVYLFSMHTSAALYYGLNIMERYEK